MKKYTIINNNPAIGEIYLEAERIDLTSTGSHIKFISGGKIKAFVPSSCIVYES